MGAKKEQVSGREELEEVYEPREDSFLLAEQVRLHAFGKVLDMGTGSGIQAETAKGSNKVKEVLAVDINKAAVKEAKKKGIKAKQSDLFSDVKGKFDTIIFNPPYLPQELKERDLALEGGKKGYETIMDFLGQASNFLKAEGIILLLFSSLTKKEKVEELIDHYGFEPGELSRQRIFFEELFVYKIKKSEQLKILESNNIKDIQKLAKGHRGMIYTGRPVSNSRKIAAKFQRKDIDARETVNNESRFLRILNKNKIGPKIISTGEGYFIYRYVPGVFLPEFMEQNTKKDVICVLKEVFDQCYTLDSMRINKEEMHHPYKHIIVSRSGKKTAQVTKVTLIDFERARYTEDPHNVTQFCQYLISGNLSRILVKKSIVIDKAKMISLAKKYKAEPSKKNFQDIK